MDLEMKVGDVINFKGKGPLSFTISKFTNSPYVHSALYIGKGKIIESHWNGVQYRDLREYKERDFDVFRHPTANKLKRANAIIWAQQQVGKKYDYFGLIGIGFSILTKKRDNPFDDKDRYWCSELIADAYLKSKIHLNVNPKTYLVSPGDLAKNLEMVISYEPK